LTKNPWTPWLARLRRPDDKSPKRITDYQFYMQHPDFKERVATTFHDKHWDAPRAERLARRCEVAREMFQAELEEVKTRIREEAKEEHEGEVRRWQDAIDGLPSMDPVDQEEYVYCAYCYLPLLLMRLAEPAPSLRALSPRSCKR
jgi:hypothetical protein